MLSQWSITWKRLYRLRKIVWKITELWQKKESNQTKTCTELNSVMLKQENKWKTHIYRSSAEYILLWKILFSSFLFLTSPPKIFQLENTKKGHRNQLSVRESFDQFHFLLLLSVSDSRIFFLVLNRTMKFRCNKRRVKKKRKVIGMFLYNKQDRESYACAALLKVGWNSSANIAW